MAAIFILAGGVGGAESKGGEGLEEVEEEDMIVSFQPGREGEEEAVRGLPLRLEELHILMSQPELMVSSVHAAHDL